MQKLVNSKKTKLTKQQTCFHLVIAKEIAIQLKTWFLKF